MLDKKLLAFLNKAERNRVGALAINGLVAGFDGVSQTEFIQVGNRCFRVELDNPLEPGSQESWFRVRCPP